MKTQNKQERVRRVLFEVSENQYISATKLIYPIAQDNSRGRYDSNIVVPIFRTWLEDPRKDRIIKTERIDAYVVVFSPRWESDLRDLADKTFRGAKEAGIPRAICTEGELGIYERARKNYTREQKELKQKLRENPDCPRAIEQHIEDIKSRIKTLSESEEFLREQIEEGAEPLYIGEPLSFYDFGAPIIADWLKTKFNY